MRRNNPTRKPRMAGLKRIATPRMRETIQNESIEFNLIQEKVTVQERNFYKKYIEFSFI
jgi:hypothetical protein